MTINLKTLVLFTCLPYLFLQVVGNGLITTSVSSLQTRYMFSGVDIGIIFGMFDLGCIVVLIIVAFVGEDANKPRWLGGSSLIVGIACLLFTIPHFTTPEYEYETSDFNNYCGNVTEPDCHDKGLKKYMGVFIVSMLLAGGGFAPIFTYGITYIDDNSTTRESSVYVSVFYLMAALGPVIGFLMGGSFTESFVQPMKQVHIDSSSPLWVGAWWPGYIICGALAILSAMPIFFSSPKIAIKDHVSNTATTSVPNKTETVNANGRIILIRELLLNPIFMLATVTVALTQAFILGFNSFGIKYTESQFGLTTFMSSLAYGMTGVFFVLCGHVTSAIVMGKFKLDVNDLMKYCVICASLSVIFTFGFFFYCEDDKFAGGTVKYSTDDDDSRLQLNSSCNAHCGCTTDWYNPVRGSDDVVYYSPCYAGCQVSTNVTTYENCSCIAGDFNRTFGSAASVGTTSESFCTKLIGYLLTFGLAVYTSILTVSPTTQITIRHVGDKYKSAAIGLQQLIALVLGNIPGRIITGKVLDTACVAWSTKCGATASCKVYKKWDMALYTFLLLVCETIVIFLIYLTIYCISRPSRSKDMQTTKQYPNTIF